MVRLFFGIFWYFLLSCTQFDIDGKVSYMVLFNYTSFLQTCVHAPCSASSSQSLKQMDTIHSLSNENGAEPILVF